MNMTNEKTIAAALCGADGFKAFVVDRGGLFVGSRADGRIFRGDADVVRAVTAAGFDVEPWVGADDPKVSPIARDKAASRTTTFLALTPVGALVV